MSDSPIGGKWTTLSRDMHFSNDHLAVMTERIRTPAREEPSTWTIVQRKSAVVIAAMTAEGKLLLVRQERIPIRDTIWEMPAGQVDEVCDVGSFKDVALRELREETGYELTPGGEIFFLGDFFCSPGFTDEREFLFLVRPVRPHANGPAHGEQESILDCQEFSAVELTKMIADGDIRDANTLATFARLVARGLISPG
ncbi:MAG: NUDIX hydrolase [Verrucomicrobiota bacterium]|nr:NUDIX hydrolase [Verrucomicrobiota bacterium]